jgi:hypothetical protein
MSETDRIEQLEDEIAKLRDRLDWTMLALLGCFNVLRDVVLEHDLGTSGGRSLTNYDPLKDIDKEYQSVDKLLGDSFHDQGID